MCNVMRLQDVEEAVSDYAPLPRSDISTVLQVKLHDEVNAAHVLGKSVWCFLEKQ